MVPWTDLTKIPGVVKKVVDINVEANTNSIVIDDIAIKPGQMLQFWFSVKTTQAPFVQCHMNDHTLWSEYQAFTLYLWKSGSLDYKINKCITDTNPPFGYLYYTSPDLVITGIIGLDADNHGIWFVQTHKPFCERILSSGHTTFTMDAITKLEFYLVLPAVPFEPGTRFVGWMND